MNTIPVRLSTFGEALTSRVVGIQVKDSLLPHLEAGESVTFDFSGVRTMSTGFAKELFGGLFAVLGHQFAERIRFDFGDQRSIFLSAVKRGISVVHPRTSGGEDRSPPRMMAA